jgi:hypothetical protein
MSGGFTFDIPFDFIFKIKFQVYFAFIIGLFTVYITLIRDKEYFSRLKEDYNNLKKGHIFYISLFIITFSSIIFPHLMYYENWINGDLNWTFWRIAIDIGILTYLGMISSYFKKHKTKFFETIFEFTLFYGRAFYISLISIYLIKSLSRICFLEIIFGVFSLLSIFILTKDILFSNKNNYKMDNK